MQRPDNIHDALTSLHRLTLSIAMDLAHYVDNPADCSFEYFEDVKAAALDAHMLVTWIEDNIKEMQK